ncbi:hypothetical protein B0H14DRAFT_3886055, partial [Mycena olivaceomarginata]
MASGFRSLTATIVAGLADCAVIILCLPCYLALRRRQRASCVPRTRPRQRRSPPQTLPKTRLDLAIAGKPQACQFFGSLWSYDSASMEVLGGRVVHLELAPSPGARTTVVGAAFYQPSTIRTTIRRGWIYLPRVFYGGAILLPTNVSGIAADPVPTQHLLRLGHRLEMVVLIGLGSFCLQDIRSLYLYHSYRTTPYVPPWSIVFPLLQQMHSHTSCSNSRSTVDQ